MVRVVLDQLVEEGCRLKGSLVVRQEESQVEQGRTEVLLQLNGLRRERRRAVSSALFYEFGGKDTDGKFKDEKIRNNTIMHCRFNGFPDSSQ